MIIDVALFIVIISLIVERYLYARDMNSQVNDNFKALLSRNVNEYASLKGLDNKKPEAAREPDTVPIESVNDKDWLDALKKGVDDG